MTITAYGLTRAPAAFGLNRLLSEAFSTLDWPYSNGTGATWAPAVDIFEDADGIRILAEVPGVKPEDVKISVENNVLTIQGKKEHVTDEKTEHAHRYERTYGAFERTFTLPTTVDAARIKATYEHGVLRVNLPKAEQARPRQIQVQVEQK